MDYRVGADNLREATWPKDDGGPTACIGVMSKSPAKRVQPKATNREDTSETTSQIARL
jgi:hypothetical protein